MGNRAYIVFTTADETKISPAVYLHWNAGPESIYAYLAELDRRRVRDDPAYTAARFVSIVAEHFDHSSYTTLSLGVDNGPPAITLQAMEFYSREDNGSYVVYRDHRAVKRVRRFVYSGAGEYRELAPQRVACERKTALAHRYNTGPAAIASVFDQDKPVLG